MKWLVLFFTLVADALKIENVIFEEYAMYGATVTMVCEYQVGESEYVDSIKWYKDNSEFYRIVPHTSIEKDKVVTFNRSGINLDLQRSGVSTKLYIPCVTHTLIPWTLVWILGFVEMIIFSFFSEILFENSWIAFMGAPIHDL